MQEAALKEPIEFWCDVCDANRIHSKKPETGKFFRQWGHGWKLEPGGNGGKVSDDFLQVIFAICKECLLAPQIAPTSTSSQL